MYDNILLSNTRTQYRSSSLNKLFLFYGPTHATKRSSYFINIFGGNNRKKSNKNKFPNDFSNNNSIVSICHGFKALITKNMILYLGSICL